MSYQNQFARCIARKNNQLLSGTTTTDDTTANAIGSVGEVAEITSSVLVCVKFGAANTVAASTSDYHIEIAPGIPYRWEIETGSRFVAVVGSAGSGFRASVGVVSP